MVWPMTVPGERLALQIRPPCVEQENHPGLD